MEKIEDTIEDPSFIIDLDRYAKLQHKFMLEPPTREEMAEFRELERSLRDRLRPCFAPAVDILTGK